MSHVRLMLLGGLTVVACSGDPGAHSEWDPSNQGTESTPLTKEAERPTEVGNGWRGLGMGPNGASEQGPFCGGPAHVVSQGGRITETAEYLTPVFWGPNVASDTVSNISTFLKVLAPTWETVLNVEYVTSTILTASPVTITPHVSTGSTVTRAQIKAELNWQVANSYLPAGDANHAYLFLVHFPSSVVPLDTVDNVPNTPLCADALPPPYVYYECGYHDSLQGERLTFAAIPDHVVTCGTNWCGDYKKITNSYDAMTVLESHEIAEALTNPDGTGFLVRSPKDSTCANDEIGDICQSQSFHISNSQGSAWVQAIWSNKANACVTSVASSGDVDGDGLSDLMLTGGAGWTTMPVALANGDGSYRGMNAGETSGDEGFATYATQAGARPIAGDFDGDGHADIALVGGVGWNTIPVAFTNPNSPGTYHGTNGSDGGFSAYYQSGFVPVAGDFDGDGRGDIALVGPGSWTSIPIAHSNGDGTFSVTNASDGGFHAYYQSGFKTVAGDYDCDGLADIALVGPTNWGSIPVAHSSNTLNGSFTVTNGSDGGFHAYYQSGFQPVSLPYCGVAEIALVGHVGWTTIPFALGNIAGTFQTGASPDQGLHAYYQTGVQAASGDFNADGADDIALIGGSGWSTMPIAFNLGVFGFWTSTNKGETSGDTSFAAHASQSGARVVTK